MCVVLAPWGSAVARAPHGIARRSAPLLAHRLGLVLVSLRDGLLHDGHLLKQRELRVDRFPLDDALEQAEVDPWPIGLDRATSWGKANSLRTWSSPKVAAITGRARDAELRALAAGPSLAPRAARELLVLQASDWAFLEADDLAGPYPLERFSGHLENFNEALASVPLGEAALRNLAQTLSLAPLLEP